MLLGDILKQRVAQYLESPETLKKKGVEYNKKWNEAVGFFHTRINKQRKIDGLKPLPFMAIREKLVVLPEIDDLKWMWKYCEAKGRNKDKDGKEYGFSRIFFASLKIR